MAVSSTETSQDQQLQLKMQGIRPFDMNEVPALQLCHRACIFFLPPHRVFRVKVREANFSANISRQSITKTTLLPVDNRLLKQWHRMLGLSRQSPPSWYRDRLREEPRERQTANTFWQKLSETSDVFFSISRARYDGFPVRKLPAFVPSRHFLVYVHMMAKYTLRWKFYPTAAILCNAPHYDLAREVVNHSKDHKLNEVAFRHGIHLVELGRVARQLRRVWPLLP